MPDDLQPEIFRANKVEQKYLDEYLKGKGLKPKDIFDYISANYIDKKNFKYSVNKYIVANPLISKAFKF